MAGISSSVGLSSGIDYGKLTDAIIEAQRAPINRLNSRLKNIQSSQTGITTLQASLLSVSSSVSRLSDRTTFRGFTVQNSDTNQLTVTTRSTAIAGSFQFQAIRKAAADQSVSKGFVNADTQQIGQAGTITFASGGQLTKPTSLDVLNGGAGIRRGQIRITNRNGFSADIDLRNAVTVDDVTAAINNQAGLGVRAKAVQGKLTLVDETGGLSANLSVTDIGGGSTAADLGIRKSVAGATITGDDVYRVSSDFALRLLNDGNGLRQKTGVPDLRFGLVDGTQLDIDFDGGASIGDLVGKINNATGNAGKLTATLTGGRIQLVDNTAGAGTFTASNLNGSNATYVLGIDRPAVGNTLNGQQLIAGLNSVQLRNLRGGQGIATPGQVTLTDRTGKTATIDLTNAQSLDEVLETINSAKTSLNESLSIKAEIDPRGTGITVTDTSGSSVSNLIVADVGAGTTAQNLGITVNGAQTSVSSGNLNIRRVNEATSLANYGVSGGAVAQGSFKITNRAGVLGIVSVGTSTKTIGDVIDAINAQSGLNVTAKLNETGDGIAIVDNSSGTGSLLIEESGGKTATDLRLAGTGVVGVDGKPVINGRQQLSISVAATDTLDTLTTKINGLGGTVRAAVVNSGSQVNPFRLSISSTTTGASNQVVIDDGSLNLGFNKLVRGQDAVLKVGGDSPSAFFLTSRTNTFASPVTGIDVTIKNESSTIADVSTVLDSEKISSAIESFVDGYNKYIEQAAELTTFDAAANRRGVLQGEGVVVRVQQRFTSLFTRQFGASTDGVRGLADVGVTLGTNGKLRFDPSVLDTKLQNNPEAVTKFFTDINTGIGKQLSNTLDEFNDENTGTLTQAARAYERSSDTLSVRIEQLSVQLEVRRNQLTLRFSQLESTLSGFSTQQSALTQLSNFVSSLNK
jgi:flagellar hook-associated protein 2